MRAAVRIVLDSLDAACDSVFISFEINDSVMALVPTAFVPRCDSTVIIAPARIGLRR